MKRGIIPTKKFREEDIKTVATIGYITKEGFIAAEDIKSMEQNEIGTVSGGFVNVIDTDPDTIDIEDIAHGLSLINRFNGQIPRPYSIAQHSIEVSKMCPSGLKLYGLLHNAAKAYLSDITRPVKVRPDMEAYWKIEDQLLSTILVKYKLNPQIPDEVKMIDEKMTVTEGKYFGHDVSKWRLQRIPYDIIIINPMPWTFVKKQFLKEFIRLYK